MRRVVRPEGKTRESEKFFRILHYIEEIVFSLGEPLRGRCLHSLELALSEREKDSGRRVIRVTGQRKKHIKKISQSLLSKESGPEVDPGK